MTNSIDVWSWFLCGFQDFFQWTTVIQWLATELGTSQILRKCAKRTKNDAHFHDFHCPFRRNFCTVILYQILYMCTHICIRMSAHHVWHGCMPYHVWCVLFCEYNVQDVQKLCVRWLKSHIHITKFYVHQNGIVAWCRSATRHDVKLMLFTMAKCYHRNCAHIVWTAVYSVKFTSCCVILVSRIRHRVCTYCSCPWLQIYRRYAWGSDDI